MKKAVKIYINGLQKNEFHYQFPTILILAITFVLTFVEGPFLFPRFITGIIFVVISVLLGIVKI